jgi:hypothetical protein
VNGGFDPEAVIGLLGRHGVRYVVIGGLAAVTHGAPLVTQDVDICYARDPVLFRGSGRT